MSCFHGNPHDDCDLCEAIDSVWRKYSDLKTEKDARIAELTAEVASLRNALISITHEVRFSVDPITDHIATIARNALKEVV